MNRLALAGRPVYVGARVGRVEDDRLLAGRGSYVADIRLEGAVEMAVVRSQIAHARLRGIDVQAAAAMRGIYGVFTAADLSGVEPFPDFFPHVQPVKAFPLARDKVRYVGEPVVVVVAEDRYLAEDAAELVTIDYEELPAVASVPAALADGAPRLYDEWPDNKMVDSRGHNPAVEEAFREAHRVVQGRYSIQRHASMPIETRGSIAEDRQGRLTLWTTAQSPHIARTILSMVLGIPERDLRVIAPDVGGGFGCKCHVYPEEALVCWLARHLGRPVRWVEDRAEHLVSTVHSREHVIELEAAVEEDGRIAAIRGHVTQDVGAGNIWFPGHNPSFVAAGHITGPYRIEHAETSVTCAVTNKTPSGAFRGFGIPEIVFALERLVERIAVEVGVDAVELRRRMLLTVEDLPFVSATGGVFDSGSFREAFERCVEMTEGAAAAERTAFSSNEGVRIGVGYATYVEGTAPTYIGSTGHWTSYDSATIRIDPDGSVTVAVGVATTGQGVTTMVATLAADALGVPRDSVSVHIGDTDLCPYGLGAWGSRSTVAGGGAVLKAAGQVREKALRIAAHLLEADLADVVVENGIFHPRGSERPSVSVAEVATAAWTTTMNLPPGVDPGLEAVATYDPPGLEHAPDALGRMNGAAAWSNATHGAVVKIDLETGEVEILHYFVVHDCGPMINPPIVEGQVVGGVAHGIGGTLYEDLPYGAEGQPLAGGFMDYLVPTATEIPRIRVEHIESPAPNMPLGVKGVGEGGIIGPPAAIADAVADALREFGVDVTAMPLSPMAVRNMVQSAPIPLVR